MFLIDLNSILFKEEVVEGEVEDNNKEKIIEENNKIEIKSEPMIQYADEESPNDEDDDDYFDQEQEEISDESDEETKPLSQKRKLNNYQCKSKVPKLSDGTQPSQLMSKHKNYSLIQDKYKDYLCITIPNIETLDFLKFSKYIPRQPLESYWKAPRPPSRKKKPPKDYDKYPLGCDLCSKRFTSEILQAFHLKVYHSPHYQCPYCPNAYHQEEQSKFKKHLYNHEHVTKTAKPHECIQCGKEDFCLQRLQKHIGNVYKIEIN